MIVNCLFETQMAAIPRRKFEDDTTLYAKRVYGSLCNVIWARTTRLPPGWEEDLREAEVQRVMIRKGLLYRTVLWLVSHGWLSNQTFYKFVNWAELSDPFPGLVYECSWRYAAALMVDFRNKGGDYLDFYCSGLEGIVDAEFEDDMRQYGWYAFTHKEIFGK
jgi:hypothetical protein